MPVQLNHTIVAARDKRASAEFLADVLGLEPPTTFGPFVVVALDNDVSLDDGAMWPTSFALTEVTPEVEARIAALVERAVR